ASAPAARMSAATASSSSRGRAARATRAPARASVWAKCRPRPLEAPVTSAAAPFRFALRPIFKLSSAVQDRHCQPRHADQAAFLVFDADLPHLGRAADVERSRRAVNIAAAHGADMVGVDVQADT